MARLKEALFVSLVMLSALQGASASIQHEVSHEYSSVITYINSTETFLVTVKNTGSDRRELRTIIENVNAFFNAEGDDRVEYSLNAGENRTFRITLAPDEVKDADMKIVTHNKDLQINTTTVIPVTIRQNPASYQKRQAPGIGFIHVILLAGSSLFLYCSRL
ncbi:MAG: hypothetical protein ABEJ56_00440 [Candidatus Nanohaloarchaea archaeon]